jgi:hypothetical protein
MEGHGMKPLAVCIFGASMFCYGYGEESFGTMLLIFAVFVMVKDMGDDE